MSWTRRHKHVAARVGTVDETKLAAADGGRVAVDLDRTACAAASELGNQDYAWKDLQHLYARFDRLTPRDCNNADEGMSPGGVPSTCDRLGKAI